MKYKVGQKVKVKNATSGGNFYTGDIVKIVQIGDDDGYNMNCYGAISPWDGCKWYLNEDEVEPVTNGDKLRAMRNKEIDYKELLDNPDFSSPAKIAEWMDNASTAITELLERVEMAEKAMEEVKAELNRARDFTRMKYVVYDILQEFMRRNKRETVDK